MLIDNELLRMFAYNLTDVTDIDIIKTILEALDNVLNYSLAKGEYSVYDFHPLYAKLEEVGLLDIIEGLQGHSDAFVHKQAEALIKNWLPIDSESL